MTVIDDLQEALMDKPFMATVFLCFAVLFFGFGLWFYFSAVPQYLLAGYCMFGTVLSMLTTGFNWLLVRFEQTRRTQTSKQTTTTPGRS